MTRERRWTAAWLWLLLASGSLGFTLGLREGERLWRRPPAPAAEEAERGPPQTITVTVPLPPEGATGYAVLAQARGQIEELPRFILEQDGVPDELGATWRPGTTYSIEVSLILPRTRRRLAWLMRFKCVPTAGQSL